MDFDRDHDTRVRSAAFDWLTRQVSIHDDVLPRATLAQGFDLDGRRVPVIGPAGHFQATPDASTAFDHHGTQGTV